MAKNRVEELRDAIKAAEVNGWEYIGAGTVRRMAEHDTPDMFRRSWPDPKFHSTEFISFILVDANRVPKCVYGVAPATWTTRQDVSMSYKRALELLAQPLSESDVHN